MRRGNLFQLSLRASFAKSLDPQSRLFTSLLFRLRDAKFPSQAADVKVAEHLVLLVQFILIDSFKDIEPEFEGLTRSDFGGGSCKGGRPTCRDKFADGSRQSLGYPLQSSSWHRRAFV